jgi:hypothetical protein
MNIIINHCPFKRIAVLTRVVYLVLDDFGWSGESFESKIRNL